MALPYSTIQQFEISALGSGVLVQSVHCRYRGRAWCNIIIVYYTCYESYSHARSTRIAILEAVNLGDANIYNSSLSV